MIFLLLLCFRFKVEINIHASHIMEEFWNLIYWRAGPPFNVNLRACVRSDVTGCSRYLIACFKNTQEKAFRRFRNDHGYQLENPCQMKLFNKAKIIIKLEGRYLIDTNTEILELE